MSVDLNASWTAPAQPLWNITTASCVQYSSFFSFIVSGDIAKVDNFYDTVPVGTARNFMRAMIPEDWTPQPEDADLFLWYETFASGEDSLTNDTLYSVLDKIYGCGSTICPYLDWNGDADLSGIGVRLK